MERQRVGAGNGDAKEALKNKSKQKIPAKKSPAAQTFVMFVRGWITLVAFMALGNSVQCFIKPDFVWTKLYNESTEVGSLTARTYGMWTLLASLVRFMYACNMHNWELFLLTFASYVLAFGHFTSEMLVYHSAGLDSLGMLSAVVVSGASMVLLLVVRTYIWPASHSANNDDEFPPHFRLKPIDTPATDLQRQPESQPALAKKPNRQHQD